MPAPSFDLARLAGQLHSDAWLLEPSAHAGLVAALDRITPESLAGVVENLAKERAGLSAMTVTEGIAEIQVSGPLLRSPGLLERLLLGASDSTALASNVEQAGRRSDVKGVLLVIDSPGGSVTGTPEFADAVQAAARVKPVLAFTDGMMASAAYWIGSQATAVLASKSANVGSVGVYLPWIDTSKRAEMLGIKTGVVANTGGTFKGMGHPGTSYTDAQFAHLQARADEMFAMFKGAVTSTRSRVPASAMQGQCFMGAAAQALGLIDGVSSYFQAWEKISAMAGIGGSQAKADASPMAVYEALKSRMISASTPQERGLLLLEMQAFASAHPEI